LAIANAEARKAYHDLLAGFLADRPEVELQPGGEIHVPRPFGQTAYALLVRRLPRQVAFDDTRTQPAAVVFLHDGARISSLSAGRIASAFGLTRREAELAAALYAGQSLGEHAAGRGVQVSTARFHLYHAMAKMGVRRQSDMIRQLDRLLPPMRSSPAELVPPTNVGRGGTAQD